MRLAEERQNYRIPDLGVMKEPVNIVTVAIDGIGELTNELRQ